MSLIIPKRAAFTFLIANLLFLGAVQGQAKIWDRGGGNNNWSDAANWNPDGLPTAMDDVIIPDNFTVNVNIPGVCKSLLLQSGPNNTILSIDNGQSLTVSGGIVLEAPTANNRRKRINVNTATLSCASITMAATGNGNRDCDVRITTGTVTVSGDITMNGASNENAMRFSNSGTGTLNIGGSMAGGNFIHTNSSTVNYNGAGPQSVKGDTYGNLTFSGGGLKTLAGTTTVNRVCTFNLGIVNSTAANTLIFGNNGSVSGGSNNSHVNGPVRRNSNSIFTFPTGNAGKYAPITISASSSDFTAQYFNTAPTQGSGTGIDHVSSTEYWQLTRNNGGNQVTVTLSWNSAERSGLVTDLTALRVARYLSGTSYADMGGFGVGTTAAGTITSTATSPNNNTTWLYTLGSSLALPTNPLPIELTSFSGRQEAQYISLRWSTATEQNNDYMAVERSADGRTFQELGRVQGAGTTLEPQEYSFLDEKPLRGLNYYRLRQVDFDGAVEYHKVISVEFYGKGSAIGVSAFPNPANEMLYASWAASTEQPATLRVLDMTGRQVAQYTAQAGAASFELPLNNLPAGLYFLEVRQGSEVEVVRFRKE